MKLKESFVFFSFYLPNRSTAEQTELQYQRALPPVVPEENVILKTISAPSGVRLLDDN